MVKIISTYSPSNKEIQEMYDLYLSMDTSSIYQDPKFAQNNSNSNYFFIKDLINEICSYSIVIESSLTKLKGVKTAHVYYGVISKNLIHKNLILNHITNHYKKKLFSEIFIYYLNENFTYQINSSTIKFDKLKRGTLYINLKFGIEDIYNNFSKHLKRNLNKGEKLNLNIRLIEQKESENAYLVYVQMSKKRGINYLSKSEFERYYEYGLNSGFCIGCFYNDVLIGGMICIIQGNRIEYFIGFTDPNYKHLPQSHLTFYKAIEISSKLNVTFFDMGGAVLDVNNDSQLFNINKFKLGFTKNFIPYQDSEKIITNKFSYLIKMIYLIIHKKLVK